MSWKLNNWASLVALLVCGCMAGGNRTTWEYMPDMTNSPAVKAQEEPMRIPPAGTLPENFEPYVYAVDQGDAAGRALKNPAPISKEVLLRGQVVYNNTCVVCHGPKGDGDGFIVPKFPRPPSLLSDKVRDWTDGRIFHVILRCADFAQRSLGGRLLHTGAGAGGASDARRCAGL